MTAGAYSFPRSGVSKGAVVLNRIYFDIAEAVSLAKDKAKSGGRKFSLFLIGVVLFLPVSVIVLVLFLLWKFFFQKKVRVAKLEMQALNDELEVLLEAAKHPDTRFKLTDANFFSKERYKFSLGMTQAWEKYQDVVYPDSLDGLQETTLYQLGFFLKDTIPFLEENKRTMLLSHDYLAMLDELRPKSEYFQVLTTQDVESGRSGVYKYLA